MNLNLHRSSTIAAWLNSTRLEATGGRIVSSLPMRLSQNRRVDEKAFIRDYLFKSANPQPMREIFSHFQFSPVLDFPRSSQRYSFPVISTTCPLNQLSRRRLRVQVSHIPLSKSLVHRLIAGGELVFGVRFRNGLNRTSLYIWNISDCSVGPQATRVLCPPDKRRECCLFRIRRIHSFLQAA